MPHEVLKQGSKAARFPYIPAYRDGEGEAVHNTMQTRAVASQQHWPTTILSSADVDQHVDLLTSP